MRHRTVRPMHRNVVRSTVDGFIKSPKARHPGGLSTEALATAEARGPEVNEITGLSWKPDASHRVPDEQRRISYSSAGMTKKENPTFYERIIVRALGFFIAVAIAVFAVVPVACAEKGVTEEILDILKEKEAPQ